MKSVRDYIAGEYEDQIKKLRNYLIGCSITGVFLGSGITLSLLGLFKDNCEDLIIPGCGILVSTYVANHIIGRKTKELGKKVNRLEGLEKSLEEAG